MCLGRGGPIPTRLVYFFQFSNLSHLKNYMGGDAKILKPAPFTFDFCFYFFIFDFLFLLY